MFYLREFPLKKTLLKTVSVNRFLETHVFNCVPVAFSECSKKKKNSTSINGRVPKIIVILSCSLLDFQQKNGDCHHVTFQTATKFNLLRQFQEFFQKSTVRNLRMLHCSG